MKKPAKTEEREESLFLNFIGDSPTTRLLEYLIIGKDFDYTLTDLMNAGISWSTLNRIFPNFIKNKIATQTRTIGKIKLYKLNVQNPLVKKLIDLFDSIIFKSIQEKAKIKLAA